MEVEEFLKEAAVMKEIKHPNLVQLLGMLRVRSILGGGGGFLYSDELLIILLQAYSCLQVK